MGSNETNAVPKVRRGHVRPVRSRHHSCCTPISRVNFPVQPSLPSPNRVRVRLAGHHAHTLRFGETPRPMGAPKAITVHKASELIYSMLRYSQTHRDLKADYYERQYQDRALRAAKRSPARLDYQLMPLSDSVGLTYESIPQRTGNCRLKTESVRCPHKHDIYPPWICFARLPITSRSDL